MEHLIQGANYVGIANIRQLEVDPPVVLTAVQLLLVGVKPAKLVRPTRNLTLTPSSVIIPVVLVVRRAPPPHL